MYATNPLKWGLMFLRRFWDADWLIVDRSLKYLSIRSRIEKAEIFRGVNTIMSHFFFQSDHLLNKRNN
jgi:hypothetical protein